LKVAQLIGVLLKPSYAWMLLTHAQFKLNGSE